MKTIKELEALSNRDLRAMLSGMLEWKTYPGVQPFMWKLRGTYVTSHDYPGDLNACRKVEELQGWLAPELDMPTYNRFEKYITALRHLRGFAISGRECCASPRERTISLIFVLQDGTINTTNDDHTA